MTENDTQALEDLRQATELLNHFEELARTTAVNIRTAKEAVRLARLKLGLKEPEPSLGPLRDAIIAYCQYSHTLTEIYTHLGITKAYASVILGEMVKKRLIARLDRGVYCSKKEVL